MHHTNSGIRKVLTRSRNFRIVTATIVLAVVFLLQPHISGAQTFNNNLDLYIGYSSIRIEGDSIFRNGLFVTPAFYSNFQSTWGLVMIGSWDVHDFVSVGADFSWHTFYNWNSSFSNLYDRMRINTYNMSPFIKLRTPQTRHGILNFVSLFAGLGPVVGFSDFERVHAPWHIAIHSSYRNEISLNNRERLHLYGYKYTLGGQLNLSRSIGFFASFSGFSNQVQSFAFPDEKYNGTEVTMGVYFRFMNKKRFY